jgi:hypothetical protein
LDKYIQKTFSAILSIGSAAIDPANDGIFLCSGEGSVLRHETGSYLWFYPGPRIEDLSIIGKSTRAIGTTRIMAIGLIAKCLYNRAHISSKAFGHCFTIGGRFISIAFAAGNKNDNGADNS